MNRILHDIFHAEQNSESYHVFNRSWQPTSILIIIFIFIIYSQCPYYSFPCSKNTDFQHFFACFSTKRGIHIDANRAHFCENSSEFHSAHLAPLRFCYRILEEQLCAAENPIFATLNRNISSKFNISKYLKYPTTLKNHANSENHTFRS